MKLMDATVLIVDDEPMLRIGYAAWLRRAGCRRILAAANGADALALFLEKTIDIVISDIRMPVLDGIGLLQRIHESGKTVPSIIFVSGFSTVDLPVLYSMGAEAMLAKPFSAQTLLDSVTRSLAERDELWKTPMSEAPVSNVTLDVAVGPMPSGPPAEQVRFGRGGFSCSLPDTPALTPLRFSLRVDQDAAAIEGEGLVRWVSPNAQRVGVEFHYLAPGSREAALSCIAACRTASFIPL